MPDCINLKERFGRRYRIGRDPSYYGEYGPNAITPDPWYYTVECQHGHIFPWGGETLAVSTKNRGPITTALSALPVCEVQQDGDRLSVLPTLVYGDPPIARVDAGRLVVIGREVPLRDPPAERQLLRKIQNELQLLPGRRIHLSGAEIAEFAKQLEGWG